MRGRFWLKRIVLGLFTLLVALPVFTLLLFRFVPVPVTPQMAVSFVTGQGLQYRWRANLPPFLGRAVIGAEDQNFCGHNGFDWKAIESAIEARERGGRLRGASTISQQTARTLFLGYSGGWVRKGAETYLTVLMEALWPKRRILTAYMNLVDWGRGNFGAEAAARAYFGTSAASLTRAQAARLVAILPSPDKWRADRPGPYVAGRSGRIVARAGMVARDGLDSCLK